MSGLISADVRGGFGRFVDKEKYKANEDRLDEASNYPLGASCRARFLVTCPVRDGSGNFA